MQNVKPQFFRSRRIRTDHKLHFSLKNILPLNEKRNFSNFFGISAEDRSLFVEIDRLPDFCWKMPGVAFTFLPTTSHSHFQAYFLSLSLSLSLSSLLSLSLSLSLSFTLTLTLTYLLSLSLQLVWCLLQLCLTQNKARMEGAEQEPAQK